MQPLHQFRHFGRLQRCPFVLARRGPAKACSRIRRRHQSMFVRGAERVSTNGRLLIRSRWSHAATNCTGLGVRHRRLLTQRARGLDGVFMPRRRAASRAGRSTTVAHCDGDTLIGRRPRQGPYRHRCVQSARGLTLIRASTGDRLRSQSPFRPGTFTSPNTKTTFWPRDRSATGSIVRVCSSKSFAGR